MVVTQNRPNPNDVAPNRERAPRKRYDEGDLPDVMAGAAAGDPAAWRTLTERFGGMVMAIARSCRLNEADVAEIHQVTWLRLVENIDRIEQPERIGGWLATTARRESLRIVRSKARVSLDHDMLLRLPDAESKPLDSNLLADESAELVRRAFALLPPHCQRLLGILTAADPPPYKEISKTISMPIGSIGPTRGRCLEHLRRIMEELSEEEEGSNGLAAGADGPR
jgi:RNA polymerase sigma factor (sigma-70 family)